VNVIEVTSDETVVVSAPTIEIVEVDIPTIETIEVTEALSLAVANATFLKLDASNSPVTGNLSIVGDTDLDGAVRIVDLTDNGFVKTSGGDGTLSVSTSIDISADTNLAVSGPITLTGDTLNFDFTLNNTWAGTNRFDDTIAIGTAPQSKYFLNIDKTVSSYVGIACAIYGSITSSKGSSGTSVAGLYFNAQWQPTGLSGNIVSNQVYGIQAGALAQSEAGESHNISINNVWALRGTRTHTVGAGATGALTISNTIGLEIPACGFSNSPIVTNSYGVDIGNQGNAAVGTSYGIKIADQSGASTSYGIVIDSDDVGLTLGAAQDALIHFDGDNLNLAGVVDTSFVVLGSRKTTTGDPTGVEGLIYINTFDNAIRMFADGAWRTLTGGW
jgi:hypothetical protein